MLRKAPLKNNRGVSVVLGTGKGSGLFYCGTRFVANHGCPCGLCDGVCGPHNGCPCPSCHELLDDILASSRLKCPLDHPLTRLPAIFTCCLCHQSFKDHWTPAMRCSICSFDLCPKCAYDLIPSSFLQSSTLCCADGHPLVAMTLSSLIASDSAYRTGFNCDLCRTAFSPHELPSSQLVYHCSECNFDVCSACYTLPHCLSGHRLRKETLLSLRMDYGYPVTGYHCDKCPSTSLSLHSLETDPVYHCAQCGFDLCPTCCSTMFDCPVGHSLTRMSMATLVAEEPPYARGCFCNVCRVSHNSETDPSEMVFHCSLCKWDLCSSCANLIHPQPPPPPSPPRAPVHVSPAPAAAAAAAAPSSPMSDSDCIVCMNAEREILLQPCNHFICCHECAAKLSICPKCRSPIVNRLKIYK